MADEDTDCVCRWGLLFFADQTAQEAADNHLQMTFPHWPVYYGLFHIFDVMQVGL